MTSEWDLEQDVATYSTIDGIDGIGIWRNELDEVGLDRAVEILDSSSLTVTSLISARGFTEDYEEAIEDGRRAIQQAAAIGAPQLLVLTGPRIGVSTVEADDIAREALEALAPEAADAGITLAFEPIHPLDAACYSSTVTLGQAEEVVRSVPQTGLLFDTWNSWWEPDIEQTLERVSDTLVGVQIADWRSGRVDPRDRALPGEGVVPLQSLIDVIESTGYDGWYELEVITGRYEPDEYETMLRDAVGTMEEYLS